MAVRIFYFGILFFLIISNQSAFGQDWRDLLTRADSLSDSLDYDSAIFIGNLALREAERTSGKTSIAVAKIAYRLGEYYLTCCRYSEAESSLKRSLDIRRKILGDDHADVAAALDRLGRLYTETCRFPEADSCLNKSLATRKKLFDDQGLEMAETFLSLGALYTAWHHYEAAQPLLIKAKNIRESLLEADHPDIAECLDGICQLYCEVQRFDESEKMGLEALDIYSNKYGKEHPAVVRCQNNISELYLWQDNFAEAKALLNLSMQATEKIFGVNHRNMAEIFLLLGHINYNEDEFEAAFNCYNRALSVVEVIFQNDHVYTADCMHGISLVQLELKGNSQIAQSYLKKAIGIKERLYGENDMDLRDMLIDLVEIYVMQGKLPEAELLIKRALAGLKQGGLREFEQEIDCLSSLGYIYIMALDYEKAENYLKEAIALGDSFLDADNYQTIYAQSLLAWAYSRKGDFIKAEPLFDKIKNIYEEKYGADDINTILIQFELCIIYLHKYEPEKAEPLLHKCLEFFEKRFGTSHLKTFSTLFMLSNARRQMGESQKAFEMAKRAYDIFNMYFEENSLSMSEKDALTYIRFMRNHFDLLLTCYFEYASAYNISAGPAAEMIVNFKSRIFDRAFTREDFIAQNGDSVGTALMKSIEKAKQELSDAYMTRFDSDNDDNNELVDSLSNRVENLETDLAKHIEDLGFHCDLPDIKVRQIAELLPENSVIIEFFKYVHWSKDFLIGFSDYIAVIIDKNAEPVIVDLGIYKEIEPLINEYSEYMYRVAGNGVNPTQSDKADYLRINNKLYVKIWKPVESYLKGKDLVIICPDDKLNIVSFAGLIDRDNRYLIEKYAIHYVSSAKDLLRTNESPEHGTGLFAIGDPDFDALSGYASLDFSGHNGGDSIEVYSSKNIRSSCFALNDIILSRLPETGKEVEAVSVEWRNNTTEPVRGYLGVDATEDIFKAKAPGNRIIHIATHGFYLADKCDKCEPDSSLYRFSAWAGENPLLHSGIFLAGANLHGEGADRAGVEDGILSAYEVSTMDLNGTDLVVLSTCESGLGKIKTGEGVFGLCRAFQIAGARTVVSTLWPVMDKTSAELLSQLYDRQGRSLPETLREIQLSRINELREQNKSDHPASWAAYIILGDWR